MGAVSYFFQHFFHQVFEGSRCQTHGGPGFSVDAGHGVVTAEAQFHSPCHYVADVDLAGELIVFVRLGRIMVEDDACHQHGGQMPLVKKPISEIGMIGAEGLFFGFK